MNLRLRRGALITFSGVDCSGKSTQLELLDAALRAEGIAVARVWNRVGYTRWFQALKDGVRRLRPGALPKQGESYGRHQELGNPRTRAAWFAMASADLARLYNLTIGRLLVSGTIVLCDRYLADSHVDLRLHFPEVDLPATTLWRSVTRLAPTPDIALYFDVPLEVALARADVKGELFRQPNEMVAARLAAYRDAKDHYPLSVVNGDRDKQVIADELLELVRSRVGRRFRPGFAKNEIIS